MKTVHVCVWLLCIQREAINMRALPISHCTELGCFRVSILKSGDNKSSHNGTMSVRITRLKSLVCHSLMCVCAQV